MIVLLWLFGAVIVVLALCLTYIDRKDLKRQELQSLLHKQDPQWLKDYHEALKELGADREPVTEKTIHALTKQVYINNDLINRMVVFRECQKQDACVFHPNKATCKYMDCPNRIQHCPSRIQLEAPTPAPYVPLYDPCGYGLGDIELSEQIAIK